MRDLVIIGGGPAGLSAALNGAAEGLSVLLLERDEGLGGQAGTSSRIENYLGFNDGVSGSTLTEEALAQAERLGAEVRTNHEVVSMDHNPATGFWVVRCAAGEKHVARAVLVAVGVDYRRLEAPGGVDPHVLYGAPASEHEECHDRPVLVVGGGNSAGQAALNLADVGALVTLLVRRPLRNTMSQYLIERIATDDRIKTMLGEVDVVGGNHVITKNDETISADKIFAYIGSEPRTDFLRSCCDVTDTGFVTTNADFCAREEGMFVAGDVRAGSRKRVAVATGEGAISAANIWKFIYDRR